MQQHNAFDYRKKKEILDFIKEHHYPPTSLVESVEYGIDPEVLNLTTAGALALQAYPREAVEGAVATLVPYHPGNYNRLMKSLQDWCVRNSVSPDTKWSNELKVALNIPPTAPLFELPKKKAIGQQSKDYRQRFSRSTVHPEPSAQAHLRQYLASPYPGKDDKGLGNYYKVKATVGVEARIIELQAMVASTPDIHEQKKYAEEINQLSRWQLQDKSEEYVPNLTTIERNASRVSPLGPDDNTAKRKEIESILQGLIWAISHNHTTEEERALMYKELNRLSPRSVDVE